MGSRKTLDTVLLFALPASGKSEVRTYMDGLSPEVCQSEMHMGATLQLDDYPYVHFMHRIDDELHARGLESVFYNGPVRPFKDEFEWGTLIHLLNEDYDDLMAGRTFEVPSAAQLLFEVYEYDPALPHLAIDASLAAYSAGRCPEIQDKLNKVLAEGENIGEALAVRAFCELEDADDNVARATYKRAMEADGALTSTDRIKAEKRWDDKALAAAEQLLAMQRKPKEAQSREGVSQGCQCTVGDAPALDYTGLTLLVALGWFIVFRPRGRPRR